MSSLCLSVLSPTSRPSGCAVLACLSDMAFSEFLKGIRGTVGLLLHPRLPSFVLVMPCRGRQGAGGGHPQTAEGFGAVVVRGLDGIRAEIICLHTCAHGNTHVCVYAHSMCQSRDTIHPLELLDCPFFCFIYLPLVMPRSGLNPAHALHAIIPQQVG